MWNFSVGVMLASCCARTMLLLHGFKLPLDRLVYETLFCALVLQDVVAGTL